MVIYIHLEDGVVWARPRKMFLENIIVKGLARGRSMAEGKKVERFKKINQKILIKPRKKQG